MLNLRSLRDLPKVIAFLVLISCILVPGAFMAIRKTDVFFDESRRIESDFLAQKEVELKERLHNVLALVKTKRTVMDTIEQAKVKSHVTDIHSILSRMDAEWRTQIGDTDLQRLVWQNIQAIDNNDRNGQLVVLDQTGKLVYPLTARLPIREDIRRFRDENGDRLIDTLIPTVLRFDDVYRTFSAVREETGRTIVYTGYFRSFQPFQWIIGYVVDQADMESGLQSEILQILQNFRYRLSDYIITISADGHVLSHGAQTELIGKNVLEVRNTQGVCVGMKIVETAALGNEGGYFRFDWLNTETGQVEPKITYSVVIPGWGWTIATGCYLNPIYAQIAESRHLLKQRLITEFLINCAMWLVCLGGTWFFVVWARRKFSADVDAFVTFFQQAAHHDQKIDAGMLGISEFKELAGYANEMVEKRSCALAALENQRQQMVTLSRAIEQSPVSVVITTPDGTIEYVNPYFEQISGYSAEEAVGRNPRILKSGHQSESFYQQMWQTLKEGKPWSGEIINRRKDGSLYWELAHISPVFDEKSAIVHFVGVKEDITEHKQALEALYQAKQDAEAANVSKSRFLANMSHEIRTPMNGVIGMLGLLMDTDMTDEQRDFAHTAKVSANALLTIINDILDFSKIEAGKLELEMLDFNFRDMMEDLMEIMSVQALNKGIELTSFIHPDVPSWICGDPGRIRQILINLTGNGIKFTERGAVAVRVNLEKTNADAVELLIEVQDNGPGIPADRMNRLFQSFSQVDASTTRKHGGTGLGLAISKQLTELMGGSIGVESQPNRGARFWFTLVLEKRPAPEGVHRAPPDMLQGKRVLVVDDNPTNRELFGAYLNTWGCRFDTASSSETGLEKLRDAAADDPFDAALVDFMMPGTAGDRLGQMIKQDPVIEHTALIMLTSRGLRGDSQRMKEIGFAGYLLKPVKRQHLFECLVQVLARSPQTASGLHSPEPMVTRHTIDEARHKERRLLVVEDNLVNQKVAMLLLEKMGYRVDVAANGRDAVDALKQVRYDLVLMDQQMPEMDGLEATRVIRASAEVTNRRVPIIAMTANALKGDRERCLKAGMDDYLSKPVKPAQLKNKLDQWLVAGQVN
ncbi:MAG: response regulator [Deltaproteobacteria bacterium]|nr:response regulator [Deltaproteobacteria bacterium]